MNTGLPTRAPTRMRVRRAADVAGSAGADARDLLLGSLAGPFQGPLPRRVVIAAGGLLALLETVGLVARLSCPDGACGGSAARTAAVLDMDALGSVPRLAITALLLGAGLVSAVGIVRSSTGRARPWWLVLAGSGGALAAAKAWSVHSLLESDLGGVLPGVDVQLLFVVVSVIGLTTVLASGRHVRRDTRWATLTWLTLYACASVGLAALTNMVHGAGFLAGSVATLIEETGEAWAALGLLAVQLAGVRDLAARR